MAKTYQDLIDEARVIIQDTDSDGYRHSPVTVLSILNRALQELGRLRPDAFTTRYSESLEDILVPVVVSTDTTPDTDTEELDEDEDAEVALTDELDFPMQFYTPLVYFISSSLEIVDDEFAEDGRASMMMAQFKQTVVAL